ncbi:hypothetical protein TNCV_989201 [Trichonephila clavipes]|nr:hypothetical protein TNCV_989201 [Trichonephila clavipes]
MKSVQPTTSKNDKKESKKVRETKQRKTRVKKETSLNSEFVNLKVNVEKEDNIFLSANKPNLTSLSIPTSITDNLEHAHEGVSSIGDPKSEILLDQNIYDFLLPNKMTDSSNNCSPKYSVNKAAEKSPKSKRTPSTSEELFLNGHVLDFKVFDSSTFNLPHDKIVEQEIKVNSTDEYSFLKTSGISQNTVFSNENNSCLDKSNNLMDNQLSVSEINEFIRPESNSCVDKSNKSEDCQLSTTETNEFTRLANNSLTATAGSDVVQSGRPIFDDFFQHLWPYIGNNTANVVFQMVKRLWLIRIDQ